MLNHQAPLASGGSVPDLYQACDPKRKAQLLAFAENLWSHKEEVLDILTDTCTYRWAVDELSRSLQAIYGAIDEIEQNRPPRVHCLAVYAPSNVLLYSYVLYCVVPLLFADKVVFRPSMRVKETHIRLHQILNAGLNLPISCSNTSQRVFWQNYASIAEIVVFTGRYENGCEIAKLAEPRQLVLFFGSGVNPVIVGPKADVEDAVQDTVRMRTLNSGQDCICPDVIFVHESHLEHFLQRLEHNLKNLPIGSRKDPRAVVTPLYYDDIVMLVQDEFHRRSHSIIFGGEIDSEQNLVLPTILACNLEGMSQPIEYFAPVFNVVCYRDDAQLLARMAESDFRDHGMGLSIYGAPWLAAPLTNSHTIALERGFLELEHGNRPFGGFGVRANFVSYGGQRSTRPLLISKEARILAGS